MILALFAAQAQPVRPQVSKRLLPPIEAPNTRGWTRAGITPEELARRTDARLAATKNSISEWIATMNLPAGNGQAFGRSIFYAPGRFRIEVMKIGPPFQLTKFVWEGKGGKTRVLTDDGWSSRPGYRALPAPLASAFLTKFDDVVMRGTQGAKPVATLLASGRKLGFVAVAERRKYARSSELRLVLTKGATRYALSWREDRLLLSQIEVQSVDRKGKPTRILWSCAWGVKKAPLTAADVTDFHPSRVGAPLPPR